MLTVVPVIHDGARSAVNNIGKLLLRHARFFPCAFDCHTEAVEIQLALVSFKLHYITLTHFIFQVIVFDDFIFYVRYYMISR